MDGDRRRLRPRWESSSVVVAVAGVAAGVGVWEGVMVVLAVVVVVGRRGVDVWVAGRCEEAEVDVFAVVVAARRGEAIVDGE